MKSRLSSLLLYPLPFLSGFTASHGADNSWTNGHGDFLWNDSSANWESPATWTNGDDAIFGGTGAGAITVEAGVSAGSLIFNANGYSLGGAALTLTGPGVETAAATDTTISSVLAGSAGLTKSGAGWLRLTGANTYGGVTTVTGGALFASNASGSSLPGNVALGNGGGQSLFLIATQNNQFATGSVLNFNNGANDAKFQLRGTSQTIYGLNSAPTNFLSIIQNDESGTPGYAGGGGTGTLTINSNTNDAFYGLIRAQSGSLNLVKTGSGTLTLVNNTIAGSNSFTALTVSQGAVHLGDGAAHVNSDGNRRQNSHGGGAIQVAEGASVRFHYDRATHTIGNVLTGGGDIEFRANNSDGSRGSNDYIISTSNGGFTGDITVTDARLRTQNTASPFGDQSTTTITTSGNGQVMYHANPGGTYNYRLVIGGLGYYESNGTRLGALRLEQGSVQAGAVTLTSHAGIGSQDNGTTPGGVISGVISGGIDHGITKLGVHPITLTGVNTYSGPTIVQTGTLALSGSGSIAASTTIEVQAGAFLDVTAVSGGWTLGASQTLTGNGTVNGDFTVLGVVATGSSAGTVNANGSVTLAGGSVWQVELGGADPGQYDQLLSTGALDAGGVIALSLIDGFTPAYGDSFQIAGFSDFTDSGYSFDTSGATLGAGLEWDFSDFETGGVIAVIPESSTILLAGLGALGLLRRRR